MLSEFMTRIAYELDHEKEELRPADYFDLMGGVGFGGLVSLHCVIRLIIVFQAMRPSPGSTPYDHRSGDGRALETCGGYFLARRV